VLETLDAARRDRATVVIDTPAVTVSSAAVAIAARAGGVLYVARRRQARAPLHTEVRDQLELMGARLLGVVFNEG
jgi:Mrp family chromosome partitioning ATPase